jgi:hypothetical protein
MHRFSRLFDSKKKKNIRLFAPLRQQRRLFPFFFEYSMQQRGTSLGTANPSCSDSANPEHQMAPLATMFSINGSADLTAPAIEHLNH